MLAWGLDKIYNNFSNSLEENLPNLCNLHIVYCYNIKVFINSEELKIFLPGTINLHLRYALLCDNK